MKKYNYDFHIHSCLSPCGDDDMTPNNIVNMMALLGCDIFAITDHNSCKNAPAIMKVAESLGITAIPGMELCTSEEAHIVCLFDNIDSAMEFDSYVYEKIPPIKNRGEIFGVQNILDQEDNVICQEDRLLLTATSISAEEVVELVNSFGGVAFPSHVDKDSYSLIASLGTIPREYNFKSMEITKRTDEKDFFSTYPELKDYKIFRNSDAHYLENISEDFGKIELPSLDIKEVVAYLKEFY